METLPNNILIILYRQNSDKSIEFLCLKNSEYMDSFWQLLPGAINQFETYSDTLSREVIEKLGNLEIIQVLPTEKIFRFIDKKGNTCREILFVLEVSNKSIISLSSQIADFKWLDYNSTLNLLKFDRHKDALAIAYSKVLEKLNKKLFYSDNSSKRC